MARQNLGGLYSSPPTSEETPRVRARRSTSPTHVGAAALGDVKAPELCTAQHERGIRWLLYCGADDVEMGLHIGRQEPTWCPLCGRRLVDHDTRKPMGGDS